MQGTQEVHVRMPPAETRVLRMHAAASGDTQAMLITAAWRDYCDRHWPGEIEAARERSLAAV